MIKTIYTAIAVSLMTSLTAMDFNMDFHRKYQEAMALKLLSKRKFKDACQAFEKLAATAANSGEKSKYTAYYAISLGGMRNKYEEAMKTAAAIDDKSYSLYAQMELMTRKRLYKDVISKSKDVNLNSWPEDINCDGFALRANAFYAVKKYQEAIKDYVQCLKLMKPDDWSRLTILNKLAVSYQNVNDDEQALASYNAALADIWEKPRLLGGTPHAQIIYGIAGILVKQKKYDEALKKLAEYQGNSKILLPRILEMTGDIYTIKGEKDKAAAKYHEALKINTRNALRNYQKENTRINQKISKLILQK